MNYYFDVKLNFQENYYNYYEWSTKDEIKEIDKIPLIHINSEDFLNITTNKIKLEYNQIDIITNKELSNDNLYKYCAIFTDTNNTCAVLFDETGVSKLYSLLEYKDDLTINEYSYKYKQKQIKYQIISPLPKIDDDRVFNIITKEINKTITSIIKNNDYGYLRYLYSEAISTNIPNNNQIYNTLKDIKNLDIQKINKLNKLLNTQNNV